MNGGNGRGGLYVIRPLPPPSFELLDKAEQAIERGLRLARDTCRRSRWALAVSGAGLGINVVASILGADHAAVALSSTICGFLLGSSFFTYKEASQGEQQLSALQAKLYEIRAATQDHHAP